MSKESENPINEPVPTGKESENPINEPVPAGNDVPPPTPPSFLEGVIAATEKENSTGNGSNMGKWAGQQDKKDPPNIQKIREPLSTTTVLKMIGAIIAVSIIFFGSFLAYIVFNPEQAYFFVSIFGINPTDIAIILKRLINISFGTIIFISSIIWIITLFQAIWTPKELKRKRILGWMTALLVGIILFGILTFWAYLFSKLSKIDFTNLSGTVLIHDNDLYNNPSTRNLSKLNATTNIIGPITLKFTISENARQIQLSKSVKITRYSIDFNGARCNDGWSTVSWVDPINEVSIVCTFDTVKNYNISWVYTVTDVLWKTLSIPMEIPPIEIRWLVTITEQKNKDNRSIVTIDASKLRTLWNPRWEYESNGKVINENSITEEPTDVPIIVYFSLFWNGIDRIFAIQTTKDPWIWGEIFVSQDEVNPLTYRFQVKNLGINTSFITRIEWWIDDGSIICRDSADICEYTFSSYGKRKVIAKVVNANWDIFPLEKEIVIEEPLTLLRRALVTNTKGKLLNPQNTYDVNLKSYVIQDVLPPEEITFDARDIVVENPWYRLSEVIWRIDDGKTIEEKRWERVKFIVANTLRYNVKATYTFSKNLITGNEIKEGHDSIIIDVERKDLIPRIKIISTSDYVPARITVDGSESKSENGEIIKFIYNFGDGKPDATGDAIQEYGYTTPGNKEITLTIIDNFGNKATAKSVVILKETPKTIDFVSSMAEATPGSTVDFIAKVNGQIDDYVWTFWDNTPSLRGDTVSHVFQKTGVYTVTLTITYADGTRKSTMKEFSVIAWE